MCQRGLWIVAAAFAILLLGSLIPDRAHAVPSGTGLGPVIGAPGSAFQLVHYRRHFHYPRYRRVFLPYWGFHHHHWIDHDHFSSGFHGGFGHGGFGHGGFGHGGFGHGGFGGHHE